MILVWLGLCRGLLFFLFRRGLILGEFVFCLLCLPVRCAVPSPPRQGSVLILHALVWAHHAGTAHRLIFSRYLFFPLPRLLPPSPPQPSPAIGRCLPILCVCRLFRAIFAAFGALKFVDMSHDPSTGRHKGFCFIEYTDVAGADAALRAMNGFELAGRAIKVRCRIRNMLALMLDCFFYGLLVRLVCSLIDWLLLFFLSWCALERFPGAFAKLLYGGLQVCCTVIWCAVDVFAGLLARLVYGGVVCCGWFGGFNSSLALFLKGVLRVVCGCACWAWVTAFFLLVGRAVKVFDG